MSLEIADAHEEQDPDGGSICHGISVSGNPTNTALGHVSGHNRVEYSELLLMFNIS